MKSLSFLAAPLRADGRKTHSESRWQRKPHMSIDMCMNIIIMKFLPAAFIGFSLSEWFQVAGIIAQPGKICQPILRGKAEQSAIMKRNGTRVDISGTKCLLFRKALRPWETGKAGRKKLYISPDICCIFIRNDRKTDPQEATHGTQIPPPEQSDHDRAHHFPEPHVLHPDGRHGHHQRRLHRPQIHGLL